MIPLFFNILFFLIPLIYYKNTSELFEFNKIVTLYTFTALIVSAWIIESIRIKKFVFKKSILDWPLVGYLVILLLSSLFSIDPRTSWLGYYSRFNGGLISQVCYALLYWAYVSNLNKNQSLSTMYYVLISTAIASILAALEHFGIFATCGLMGFGYFESCWVQDVQTRVFSTLGQPNWLAALLVALLPILNFKFLIFNQFKTKKLIIFLGIILFFVTLLFTKSRSGLLAFGIEFVTFWGFIFWQSKFKYLKEFIYIFLAFSFLAFVFIFRPSNQATNNQVTVQGNSLETGGTESGTIRKFVWLGAINVFKHYPILGTGPETFAFSFPMYKPVDHNLTSEWDFVYNKAHNEYLNLLANTGVLGFLSYALLIIVSLKQIAGNLQFKIFNFQSNDTNLKLINKNSLEIKNFELKIGLLSGFIAILVTNFFGFSVVPVSLLFFLFPAVAVSNMQQVENKNNNKVTQIMWIYVFGVLLATYYILHTTYYYWKADIYYNKNDVAKALQLSPNEPLYISSLAQKENRIDLAVKAVKMAPFNQNIRRILSSILVKNSAKNPEYLYSAEKIVKEAIKLSPNSPKLYYELGVIQLRQNKTEQALSSFNTSVLLKANYKDARFGLGLLYIDLKEFDKAKEHLEYILKNIDPNDELTKKHLKEIQ